MRTILVMAVFGAALAAGCTGPQGLPPTPGPAATPTAASFNRVWDASMEVLREYRFVLDRQDRRAGVITTYPMLAHHGLEFWRPDAVTADDAWEGTIQTIYRQAVVTIRRQSARPMPAGLGSEPAPPAEPAEGAGDYVATVEIRVSRSDLPRPPVSSTSEAYTLFLHPHHISSGGELIIPDTYVPRVVDRLGRDKPLEAVLQARINSLAGTRSSIVRPE